MARNDQAGPQPGQPGFNPQGVQRTALLRALVRSLRPRSVHGTILLRHMRANHFDVNVARDGVIAEVDGRQQNIPDAPAADPEMARAIDMLPPRQNTIEQERRLLVVSFRDQIFARGSTGAALAISQAVLLLHLAQWDIGRALDEWAGLDDALDRLHVAFDRMRSPEGTFVPRMNNITASLHARLERQDERLAIMLALTERPDWRSIQLFLQRDEIQFDLVRAIVSWFKSGIEIAKKAADQNNTRYDTRFNRLPVPDAGHVCAGPVDNKWAEEPEFFRRVKDFDMSKSDMIPYPPLREKNVGNATDGFSRPLGFLINPDRATIQAGNYYVEEYFTVEAICKGRYEYARFTMPRCNKGDPDWDWPKMGQGDAAASSDEDKKKKVPFDFNDKQSLIKLNSWRRQHFSRKTGMMQRLGNQEWQPVENAKLYLLIKQFYEKHIKAQQGLSADEKSDFKLTTRDLQVITDLLNEAFVGTHPSKGSSVRGARQRNAVGTQSRRFAPNADDFGLPIDTVWFDGKRKGKTGLDDIKAAQQAELEDGKKALAKWDPNQERPATKVVAAGTKIGTNYEAGVRAGDDERTKERKRAENRSAAKPIKEAAEAAEASRARLAKSASVAGAAVEDDEDDDEEDEEGDDDDDEEAVGPGAGTKRKRDD